MKPKQRLSASVDADLLVAATAATKKGGQTVSAWVNDALRLKLEHDERLRALSAFVAEYEREHGKITDSEMDQAVRRARQRAVVVRGAPGGRGAGVGRRRSAG
jgi:hypothetical protein